MKLNLLLINYLIALTHIALSLSHFVEDNPQLNIYIFFIIDT